MKNHDSAFAATPEPLLDLAALRADTPGCERVIHFNNAGCGLMARPVLRAMLDHLQLEAVTGGYEASAARAAEVADFYASLAELLGTRPGNIAFAASATHAYTKALSAIDFRPGDVILTTRNDFISNQIAFLALRRRHGVRIVHAPDHADGSGVDVDAMARLMRSHRPRLVAATHVPTNSGLVQPVAEIGRHCRELDLLYLVDACQSVGQYPIDVEEIGCDLLTATCRKFLRGPRGSGFLYVSDRVLDAGYEPLHIDMHGARWVAPGHYRPVGTAARFEDGSSRTPPCSAAPPPSATRCGSAWSRSHGAHRPWPAGCASSWPPFPASGHWTEGPLPPRWSPSPSPGGKRSRSKRRWTRAASTRP